MFYIRKGRGLIYGKVKASLYQGSGLPYRKRKGFLIGKVKDRL